MKTALDVLEWGITAICLLAVVWLAVLIVRDRTPGRRFLNLMLGVELLLLVHLVAGIVHVARDGHGVSTWEYVAYLVGATLIVPVGVVWSSGEQTRGGTGVLVVALLVVPFMFLRLANIWAGGG
jgi:hypothetical protein